MNGEFDQAKGRTKQAVGDLTDDDELHREGKADESSGKLKDKFNDAVDSIRKKFNRN